jgi:HK97 family phage major capsid protein
MTAKELREKRAKIAAQIRELNDKVQAEGRDFDAAEQENWTKVNADYDALSKQIERQERAELVTSDQDAPAGGERTRRENSEPGRGDRRHDPRDHEDSASVEENRNLALQAWCRKQSGRGLTKRHVEACKAVGMNPRARELKVVLDPQYDRVRSAVRNGAERRAFGDGPQTVTTTAGGYVIPTGFVAELERARLQFGGILQAARILRTASGNQLEWPTTNDTGNTGELIGINTEVAMQAVTFGQKLLNAYKFSSKAVAVPVELLQDSAFNLATELGSMLGERLGRIMNTYYTTGSGSSQPQGLIAASNGASTGKTAASATALVPDEFLDMIHSVDPAYRTAARFMFHDAIMLAIRKMKDGEGRYYWQQGMLVGESDRVFGYPYTINQDMASSIASGNKTALFGDFSKFVVREVAEIRVKRLVERRAEFDQEVFIAFMRGDSEYINGGTNPIKVLLQP